MAPTTTSFAHCGAFTDSVESGEIASVTPFDTDIDSSPRLGNRPGSVRHRSHIGTPAVRRGWLRDGPGATALRRADEFVDVSWDELTELLACELRRDVDTYVNEAIYVGSSGWPSAGRFHHVRSQVHRFLKFPGGYTFSRHSYSLAATVVIMPRVVGAHDDLFKRSTEWQVAVEHTDLLVCFSGLAPVTGSDVAIMLALAHVLATSSTAVRLAKRRKREPIRMHPIDAARRGWADGDVVQLSTGAGFNPQNPSHPNAMCVHGNPDVLTDDVGTSSLAHGRRS
ncbi:MAG: molybdopterin-dependent oxidoreductase [Mycobacteriaceae bacterium]|nr:molybdopterin-dependent oxidoreductase [Mycobacteriaceae bacterium]